MSAPDSLTPSSRDLKFTTSPSLPLFTQVPNEFIDWCLPYCTPSEIKVYLYLLRRTIGFHKSSDRIGIRQICSGIGMGKKDGSKLENGTGLTMGSVSDALHGLERKKMAAKIPGSGTIADSWAPLTPQRSEIPNASVRPSVPTGRTPSVPKSRTRSVPKSGTLKRKQKEKEIKRFGSATEQHHLTDSSVEKDDDAVALSLLFEQVKIICQTYAVITCRPGTKDKRLLSEWIARGATGEVIRRAMLMGCQRKMATGINSGLASSINSLQFFNRIVNEVLHLQTGAHIAGLSLSQGRDSAETLPVGPQYWQHVEKWIKRKEPEWIKCRQRDWVGSKRSMTAGAGAA